MHNLNAWHMGQIKKGDVLLQLSLNGAQLYRNKESDCWIFIYIIHNLSPDLRYKKRFVIPGGFISGPNKPKHGDSYIYPSLYHISALQQEGLQIWDASTRSSVTNSTPFIMLATADGPAMASMTGMVGHSGKYESRLYCGLSGHCQEGTATIIHLCKNPITTVLQVATTQISLSGSFSTFVKNWKLIIMTTSSTFLHPKIYPNTMLSDCLPACASK
jgi:Transposase family tnp2